MVHVSDNIIYKRSLFSYPIVHVSDNIIYKRSLFSYPISIFHSNSFSL